MFACLGYFDKDRMDALPQAEVEKILNACGPHIEAFRASGRVRVDAGLETDAITLNRVAGSVVSRAGRFVPGPRCVGAVFIIEADTLEEAVRIASLHPTTQLPEAESLGWAIEIHPLHTLWTQ